MVFKWHRLRSRSYVAGARGLRYYLSYGNPSFGEDPPPADPEEEEGDGGQDPEETPPVSTDPDPGQDPETPPDVGPLDPDPDQDPEPEEEEPPAALVCLEFNNGVSNEYVSLPAALDVGGWDQRTYVFWIKAPASASGTIYVATDSSNIASPRFRIQIENNNIRVGLTNVFTAIWNTTDDPIIDDTWHEVIVIVDLTGGPSRPQAEKCTIQVDRVSATMTNNGTSVPTTTASHTGDRNALGGLLNAAGTVVTVPAEIRLSNMMIFDGLLTGGELDTAAPGGLPGDPSSINSLVGHYAKSSTLIAVPDVPDASTNELDGTGVNMDQATNVIEDHPE